LNELARIVARTRVTVQRRRALEPEQQLAGRARAAAAAEPARGFAAALARPGLSVIAEHKRSSPSAGVIRDDLELEDVVSAYERGGAAALSILTEEDRFSGSLADLERARAASSLPLLRKDFIVDPYQVHEARVAGADAVLLIVAALDRPTLAGLHALAGSLGLDALVEVHDAAELDVAVELGAPVIGINNRDLTTLQVDTRRTFELLPFVPDGTVIVSESGWRTRAELGQLLDAGVDAVLIGEALMSAPEIESACRELTGVRV
jgi:indole-3-glycerol phosphate synthase